MLKEIVGVVALKDGVDRMAAALERIAAALEQHLPPVPPEELPRLEEEDYRPANNTDSLVQQIYKEIELAEGPMDAEKEARVRAFIRSQYNL
jgi:hypothetical protein